MISKVKSRQRRYTKTRAIILRKMRNAGNDENITYWLTVHKSPRHIYAQVLDAWGKVICAASSIQSEVKQKLSNGGNKEAAKLVGQLVAEKAVKAGVKHIAFDRSGFRYHGRIKALADSAREHGLEF